MRLFLSFFILFFVCQTNLSFSQEQSRRQPSPDFPRKQNIDREDASAAPIVNDPAEVESLIRDFFISGSCLEIRNINSQSADLGGRMAQIGKFEKDARLDIGFDQGIVLSTGNVSSVSGPNTTTADSGFGNPHPNDQTFLEFEFKPTGDEISFNYVFASEEYPDNANETSFVCQFNDSFSFFMKKAGTTEPLENIALIPDTNFEVTINNLNNLWGNPALTCLVGDYSEFYVSNFPGTNPIDADIQETVFDGYTVPLTAKKSGLDACEWYYMKIVIEDGGDSAFDSAVFLEANSFADNSPISISGEGSVSGTQDAEEGCQNGFFKIERAGDLPTDVDFTVELSIGGSATPGVDYQALPTSVTIPANEQSVIIPVIPFIDDMTEGAETVYIEATNITCGCQNTSISSEINVVDYSLSPETIDDTFCEGGSYNFPDGSTTDESGTFEITVPRDDNPSCNKKVTYNITEVPPPNSQNTKIQACSMGTNGDFILSDADDTVTSETGMDVTYFATQADAENNTNQLPNSFNSTADTIYARITNPTTNCWSIAQVELEIVKTPEENIIENERVCDSDLDGQAFFDLSSKINEALGSQSASEYTVSFYLTDADAQAETNVITDLQNFTITSNPQTVFARINNNLNGGCNRIIPFEFEFEINPQANNIPISIPTCSVSPTATFNLQEIALNVANGEASMQVEFFEDSQAMTPISNPTAYESATNTVYGRVTDPTTGCYAFGEVFLEVLGEPQRRDQSQPLCATTTTNDQALFNLSSFNADLIGTAPNVTVTYHNTFDDANANVSGGLNPISNPDSYGSATATLYARAEASYESSFCHSVSEIALTVNPRPVANTINYQLCVESGSETDFDLLSKLSEITSESGVTVNFYTDSAAQDQITDPGSYTSGTNTVFAKVVNNNTGCNETVSVNLEVYEIPKLDAPVELTLCRTNEIAAFDLAQLKTDLESQYPQLTFSFFEDEALTTALGNTLSLESTSTAYVRYDLNGTPCFDSEAFTLTVTPTPFQGEREEFICISEGFPLPNGVVVFEPGVYDVIIQDNDNCDVLTRTKLIVSDIEFPNAFAPNGNGVNDTFGALPNNACVGQVADYHLVIFNRWGEKVFETTEFLQQWDGVFNGELERGTYLWHATYTFQEVDYNRKGTIALVY